jgi:hypothetical protein
MELKQQKEYTLEEVAQVCSQPGFTVTLNKLSEIPNSTTRKVMWYGFEHHLYPSID